MKRVKFLILCMLFSTVLFAQTKELTFPLFDGSYQYFTMKQSDDLFLSAYELGTDLFAEGYYKPFPEDMSTVKARLKNIYYLLPDMGLMLLDCMLFTPITHEEAHRAVLTDKGIGSISQPIIKLINPLMGAAYVVGVTDESLKNLRDTDLPTFIRLHIAGNESDYCITQRDWEKLAFTNTDIADGWNQYHIPPIFIDYMFRMISMVMYEQGATRGGVNIPEEANELERDIVGDDICGMIHHLYNPTAEYHRYFSAKDFSDEEKKFAKRIFWKSFLNYPIVTPLLANKISIPLGSNMFCSFNTGYCLAPYGDIIDENFFLRINNVMQGPLDLVFTARQHQNKDKWFPEFKLKCVNFSPLTWLTLNGEADLWWQPEDLSFTTNKAFVGGSVALGCNIYPLKAIENTEYEFGINMQLMYKTKGFMPEIMSLNDSLVFTAGISLRY